MYRQLENRLAPKEEGVIILPLEGQQLRAKGRTGDFKLFIAA
jgi:hypothetical protein